MLVAKAEYPVMTEGKLYLAVVSDEQAVLLAAKAAGRAVLVIHVPDCREKTPFGMPYLIEQGAKISEAIRVICTSAKLTAALLRLRFADAQLTRISNAVYFKINAVH